MVAKPQIIFADEPTGNLDRRTGGEILADGRIVDSMNAPTASSVLDRMTAIR